MARSYIVDHFEPKYLPAKPQVYSGKTANAQEAHEAIRPTHPETGPCGWHRYQRQNHKLIWQRFIAAKWPMAATI